MEKNSIFSFEDGNIAIKNYDVTLQAENGMMVQGIFLCYDGTFRLPPTTIPNFHVNNNKEKSTTGIPWNLKFLIP